MDAASQYNEAAIRFKNGEIAQAEGLLASAILTFGPGAEKAVRSAYQMFRLDREAELRAEIAGAMESDGGDLALKSLALLADVLKAKYAALEAADHADIEKRVRLFDDRSNDFLNVEITLPITTCNYRCSYCFLRHQIKPDLEKLAKLDSVIERLGLIPRPLGVSLSPAGEVSAIPAMWPFFGKLARLPNLVWAETWTNLSRDLDGLFEYIDPAKLVVVGTYHPTEFKSFERDNERFFERVGRLKKQLKDLTINVVVCEDNAPYLLEARRRLREMDVVLTYNPQINPINGYIQPITPLSGELKEIARELINNPFLEYFFLEQNRADIRCTAGRDMIDVAFDGRVSRCQHLVSDPAESLGNLLDPDGPVIDTTNRYCRSGGCSCKSTIGYAEPFVQRYKRVGTQHHFVARPEGEIGAHSYDPVELPLTRATDAGEATTEQPASMTPA